MKRYYVKKHFLIMILLRHGVAIFLVDSPPTAYSELGEERKREEKRGKERKREEERRRREKTERGGKRKHTSLDSPSSSNLRSSARFFSSRDFLAMLSVDVSILLPM
jgi:hypothetical protein